MVFYGLKFNVVSKNFSCLKHMKFLIIVKLQLSHLNLPNYVTFSTERVDLGLDRGFCFLSEGGHRPLKGKAPEEGG